MSVEHLSPVGSSASRLPTPHAGSPRRRARRIWVVVVAVLLLAVIAASAGLFAFDRSYAGRIYPNVSISGIAVGELSVAEARQLLDQHYAFFLAQPVVLTYGERTWTPTLAELGVSLELDTALGTALAAGRQNGLVANLREVLAVYQNGLELPLHLIVDQEVMQAYLLGRVTEIDQPAVDATLRLNGATITTAPAATGKQLLVADTLHEITAALQGLDPQTIALRTRELQPRLDNAAVAKAEAAIERVLAGPLTLAVAGTAEPFVWSLEDLARLVRVERVSGPSGDRLLVGLDAEQIADKLAALADATMITGEHPRLDWNGGDLKIIKAGTPGLRLDESRAAELVLAALASPAAQRELTLPMREVPSPVTAATLDQLGIGELISVGRSDFSGSAAYRVTNIKAGMRLLHGVLLAPGEEFSFNNTIGRIDESNGFVEGYAIIRNRTQLEWGGGICQDSTTMFRAAFWAGLPITERWGHSFYISWYDKFAFGEYGNGPGMDATIFTGALDLKFLNDTGNWLLIQTLASGSTAEVRIYGTDDGRKVSLLGPKTTDRVPAPTEPVYVAEPKRPRGSIRQSDTARGGMTIEFTRVIERDGQLIERRSFQTKFKPWPNIFEVHPEDLGPDGKPLPRPDPTIDPLLAPTPDPSAPPPAPVDPNAQPAPAPEPLPAPPTTGEQPPTSEG